MKKIIFLLLISIASYGQADFPEGIQITGGQPTVTSVNFLTTTEINGVQGKIDPVNLPFANTRKVQNPIYYKGKDIEWFGDSYTVGSGASTLDNRFTSIVSRALGANEINHGVAGTTMEKRVPIDYMASPNMVDNVVNIPTKTDSKAMIVFAFGLNDMGQTASAYNVVNYKTDYQFVLNNAFSKGWLPTQILIIPAYYIGSSGYTAYAAITGNAAPTQGRHLSFIQAAKEVSESNGTMYFDIYQDQVKNDTSLIGVDNIHPTNAGYAYIANDVLQYLGADKIGLTSDTGYSTGSGFIPKINNNILDNSFLFQGPTGIGLATTSPKVGWHIHSASANSSMMFTNTVTTDAVGRGTLITEDASLNFQVNNRENGSVIFSTNNVNRFGISAAGNTYVQNGNFGINITVPNYQQHVHNTLAADTYTQYTNLNTGSTSNDGFLIGINSSQNVEVANKENGFMRFHTNNLERLRIHASGGVSIGNTTDPGATNLLVAGNVTATTYNGIKRFKAINVSQTGGSAPTMTILENTIGNIVWTRSSSGTYVGTLSGAFTANKTHCIYSNGAANMISGVNSASVNIVSLYSATTGGTLTDGFLALGSLTIEVYP